MPVSRLTDHPLINSDEMERLRHARGQSLPDWLALRSGRIDHFPDGVAYPLGDEQVTELIRYAVRNGIRLIPYGGGTSVVGHITPLPDEKPTLTVDLRRLNQLHHLDHTNQLATFGCGVQGPDLEAQLRAHGYTLGHFPQSFELSTLGGWIATRSSGQQSLGYGRIEALFAGGKLESPAGSLRLPPFPASAAGPDLRQIVLGSEGRLGILTEATVRVSPLPERENFHAVFFPDFQSGLTAVRQLMQTQVRMAMLRLSTATETTTTLAMAGHDRLIGALERLLDVRNIGEDKCLLLLGFAGSSQQVRTGRGAALSLVKAHHGVHVGRAFGSQWHKGRFHTPYLRNSLWRDIVIIGGGITGAGMLHEASRLGLRTLLVEQRDFGWGTSSRSSKLVHGGLRYLKEGWVGLTSASVQERQQLLQDGPGLIDPLGFLLATYEGDTTGRLMFQAGLSVYDLLALQWSHRYYSAHDFRLLAPHLKPAGLKGGFRYGDAQTDDARLVLRLIREAVADGGVAINYARAASLKCDPHGQVNGLTLLDLENSAIAEVQARLVINATGAWADGLRQQLGHRQRIRPLRGSHLVFPSWRLPVAQAVSFLHPVDHRPVFIFPWEGITLVGTTDVDHHQSLDEEPAISAAEVAYLMAAVEAQFPALDLALDDIIASFAGVRPVIGSGKTDPSEESRDHVIWSESGLLTVTGGKLTTFRLIALDVLRAARHRFPTLDKLEAETPVLNPVEVRLPDIAQVDEVTRRRLLGRYGAEAPALVTAARPHELALIPGTPVLWAELRWAARSEGVVHLDDLLLRRVRLGLLLRDGAAALLPQIRAICQLELAWDDQRWQAEETAYLALWRRCYSLPDLPSVPDWRALLGNARRVQARSRSRRQRQQSWYRRIAFLVAILVLVGLLINYAKRQAGRSHQ